MLNFDSVILLEDKIKYRGYFFVFLRCLTSLFLIAVIFFLPGWTKRVEYTPGSGSIPLFPGLHLETCEETVWNIQATVELQTGHIGKGCDRDSYSDRSVRRLCGEPSPVEG